MYLHSANPQVLPSRPSSSSFLPGPAAGIEKGERSAEMVERSPDRYQPAGFNLRSFLVVAALHVAAVAALVGISTVAATTEPVPAVQSFDIPLVSNSPAPEQPPAPVEPQPAQTADIQPPVAQRPVAPVPKINLTQASRPVAPAIAMPAPAAPAILPAPVAVTAPAPAKVTAAPPAPVTPPDFSAAQLSNPAPEYPFLSRKAREEGVVLLRVFVTTQGRVGDIAISQSSSSPRLDRAALATVRKWRFVPAQQGGAAIAAWVVVPITFSLDS